MSDWRYDVNSAAYFFSSRSMRNCARRIASRLILVSVLPVLTSSPIRNSHFQMPGVAVVVTVYSIPRWFMVSSHHDSQLLCAQINLYQKLYLSHIAHFLEHVCFPHIDFGGRWFDSPNEEGSPDRPGEGGLSGFCDQPEAIAAGSILVPHVQPPFAIAGETVHGAAGKVDDCRGGGISCRFAGLKLCLQRGNSRRCGLA
jgi:hypothetical protein